MIKHDIELSIHDEEKKPRNEGILGCSYVMAPWGYFICLTLGLFHWQFLINIPLFSGITWVVGHLVASIVWLLLFLTAGLIGGTPHTADACFHALLDPPVACTIVLALGMYLPTRIYTACFATVRVPKSILIIMVGVIGLFAVLFQLIAFEMYPALGWVNFFAATVFVFFTGKNPPHNKAKEAPKQSLASDMEELTNIAKDLGEKVKPNKPFNSN